MELDREICYRALRARDRRFDGRFFTGVTSTGVYCRPVCPARTPRSAHCLFFACAAAAEEAGFRPCLRCRPETSPGTPAWQGSSATVSRALRLIEEGALDEGGVEELAERLGIGARHLRRLFVEHLGAPPLSVALTRRVHLARRLLEETRLPVSRVARAAGFRNARRFNAAFRERYRRTPSETRRGLRGKRGEAKGGGIELRLSYRPPLDWSGLLAFLAPRAIPEVETIRGELYRRSVRLGDESGLIELGPDPSGEALRLRAPAEAAPHLGEITRRARELGDLSADPGEIEAQLGADPLLEGLVKARPGLRVPGAWDRFELAVRAVLGQQVTVRGASRLAGRLVRAFGTPLGAQAPGDGAPTRLFPTPKQLGRAPVRKIAELGLPRARAASLRDLGRAVAEGAPLLEPAAGLGSAVKRLTALPGIGDWTAQYIAMRALREPDAFPAGDLGLRRSLADPGGRPVSARALAERAEAWRPWRAYAAMHLWNRLA
jgi:AraC family transcriptional regulator of adaptative response / DNA-3-methyladenine glycosylase II